MISIEVNDKEVLDILDQMIKRGKNLQPAMREIGEDVTESTKQRFVTATDPEGTPWASNSTETTIPRYLGAFGGSHKKDGTLSKRGEARSAAKKPLTGETRALATTINYQLVGSTGVSIGSPMVYAAMQQFGGTKAEFPHLWADIPARPFLGLSEADTTSILDIVGSYLTE